jgi:hypothetical protein
MILRPVALALPLGGLLTGCGKHYWEESGPWKRGLGGFIDNSAHCNKEAKTANGIGAEDIYRACMKAHGWRRVQTPTPNDQQFRGPEDADEFDYPPPPLSARGAAPSRAGDPACAGPTAARPPDCPRR